MIDIDYSITKLDYNKKSRKLDVKASGVVKSNKFFPVYNINGKEFIFKPLSKTKPFTTPLYSYAEVFWSNITNYYFGEAPIYKLAICNGYEKNEEKYYDQGSLVENILDKDEHLVNLLEYFKEHPDKNVNIDDYINYCMLFYDYTPIFKSSLIQENRKLGEQLAFQVLMSILRADQNYHYENVAFVCDEKNNIKKLAPIIDNEFSTYFLFPDNETDNGYFFAKFLENFYDGEIRKNIKYIIENYKNIFDDFVLNINHLKSDLEKLTIKDYGFLSPMNSENWRIGYNRYKEKNEEKAIEYEKKLEYKNIDIEKFFEQILFQLNITIELLRHINEK